MQWVGLFAAFGAVLVANAQDLDLGPLGGGPGGFGFGGPLGAESFGAPRLASAHLPLAPHPALSVGISGPIGGVDRSRFGGFGFNGGPVPVNGNFGPLALPLGPRCPPSPAKPNNGQRCFAIQDPAGCVVGFSCIPKPEEPEVVCPPAPDKPEKRVAKNCNWIAILDKNNCILEYECEPLAPHKCEQPPIAPEDNDRCKFVPMKDSHGCVIRFECTPPGPVIFPQFPSLPLALPRPALPILQQAPLFQQPLLQQAPLLQFQQPLLQALAPQASIGLDGLVQYCGAWANAGECGRNPNWMLPNCRTACFRK